MLRMIGTGGCSLFLPFASFFCGFSLPLSLTYDWSFSLMSAAVIIIMIILIINTLLER